MRPGDLFAGKPLIVAREAHAHRAQDIGPAKVPSRQKQERDHRFHGGPFGINGRRGGIRTRDPLHPMQVRYQAALHADKT